MFVVFLSFKILGQAAPCPACDLGDIIAVSAKTTFRLNLSVIVLIVVNILSIPPVCSTQNLEI